MMIIYVGDSKNVINRIRKNHCSGNVEGSTLREAVAETMGYRITRTKRKSGTTKVRIDLPNPREGEHKITDYIRSGEWRYVICNSYAEAHDFQWYAIEQLRPLLNRNYEQWEHRNFQRYQTLSAQLVNSEALNCDHLNNRQSGPGVYILYHQ